MEILNEISDRSLGIADIEPLDKEYEFRKSARAILFNNNGDIAVQYLQNHNFHKLPGGGLDPGESSEEALLREIREEVGCDARIIKPIGMTIEYRDKHKSYKLLHMSCCYVAEVVGDIQEPQLEQAEIDEGMTTLWMTPIEMLEKMETDQPNKYEGFFILEREKTFLKEYLLNKE